MRPVLFQWRGLTVFSYPAMVYVGMVAGVVAGNAAAHAAGMDALRVYIATLVLMVPALIGARWFYVASHWEFYRKCPRQFLKCNRGGAALYGGLGLVLPASLPVLTGLRLPLGAFWDVSVFTMLVLMIFGRVGCLLNGCCAGRPTQSWIGMHSPDHCGVWTRRIPTQLLEAGWGVVLLLTALVVWRSLPFPGALFVVIAAGYAVGRLALESTRAQPAGSGRFTIHHVISVLMIVSSLAVLAARWPK
jgi:phosphatidylglycerol:prolipoprotein diacylglycerol transferase